MKTDWEDLAEEFGFSSEEEMLETFYTENGWSIGKISKKIGRGTATIQARLEKYNIERRTAGGPTLKKKKVVFTDDELLKGRVKELSTRANVSIATVMRWRKVRKDEILRDKSNNGAREVRNV